jgi:hypothetical protein
MKDIHKIIKWYGCCKFSEIQYLFNTVIFFSSIPMRNLQIQKTGCLYNLHLKLYSIHPWSQPNKLPDLLRSNFSINENKCTVQGRIKEPCYFQLRKFTDGSLYRKNDNGIQLLPPQICSVINWICTCFFSTLFSIRYSNHLIVLVPT